MRLASARSGLFFIAVCAVLVLVGIWALGGQVNTATQPKVVPAPPQHAHPTAGPVPAEATPLTGSTSVQRPADTKPSEVMQQDAGLAATQPPPMAPTPTSDANAPTSVTNDLEITSLRSRALTIPVQGITAPQLNDTFTQARAGGVPHDAIDIMAPRGTAVLAVEDGRLAKLFLSKAGGITLYQFDSDNRFAYYYAHLDRYVDGLTEGATLSKGQVIGYVGSTGNASPDAPHLHFAIFKLGPERQWWKGVALNPYLVWH
jgi:murein DD-endopeptidase MepM/ murein hydrolase activator NlpD